MNPSWKTKKLGEVCELVNCGVSPAYTEQSGVLIVNQKCVRDHVVSYDLARRHNHSLKKVAPEKFIRVGDVLVPSRRRQRRRKLARNPGVFFACCSVGAHRYSKATREREYLSLFW